MGHSGKGPGGATQVFLRRGVFMENPFPTAIHDGRSRRPWLPIEALAGGKIGQQRGRGDTSALCALPIAWGL